MSKVATLEAPALELPVQFSNVSIGDGTARIGIAVDRSRLTIAKADKQLCGKRLSGTLIAGGKNDSPGQQTIPGSNIEIKGVFDVKGISMNPKKISAGLTFNLKGLNLEDLCSFAKRSGRIVIDAVEALPDGDEPEEGENGDGHD